jgi:Tfp pilus assembly protein PilF
MTAPAAPDSPRSPLAIAEVFYLLGMDDLAAHRLRDADRNLRLALTFAPEHPQVTAALEQLYRAAHQARVLASNPVPHDDLPPIY